MKKFALGLICLIASTSVFSQEDTSHFYDFDILGLLDIEVETATKKKESVFDSPISSTIISKKEIQLCGATTIEELFRLVPGMIVREITNGNFDAHIRGFDNLPPGNFTYYSSNSISLVMIDGRIVYNHMNGGTFWESLPISLTDIEKIEIVRGPNSALYGPNAASGVINIITTKSTDGEDFKVNADIKFGGNNTSIINTGVSIQPSDKLFFTFSGNVDLRDRNQDSYYNYLSNDYTSADSLRDYQNGSWGNVSMPETKWPTPNMSKRKYGINGFGRYSWSENTYLDVTANYQSSEAQTVFMESTTTPILPRISSGMGTQVKFVHKGFNIQYDAFYSNKDIQPAWGQIARFKSYKHNVTAEYEYKTEKLSIRPGFNINTVAIDDRDFLTDSTMGYGILNGRRELNDIAYFAKVDYQPTSKLRFLLAARNDHYTNLNRSLFSYQGAAMYTITNNHRLRIVFSQANRAPFFADFFTTLNAGSYLLRGNENMELMNNFSREIGYRAKLGKRVELDLEGFYQTSENHSGLEFKELTANSEVVFEYRNYLLKAIQRGATATIGFSPSPNSKITAFATYQKTHLEDYEKTIVPLNPISDNDTVDVEYKNTPNIFGGFKGYYKTDNWHFYLNGYFLGNHEYWYNILDKPVGDKLRLDATISYNLLDNSAVYITGRNVLNNNKPEFGMADNIGALVLVGFNLSL